MTTPVRATTQVTDPHTQPRACLYDRVSHDKRQTGRSVDEQRAAGLAACEAQGWHVAGTYDEPPRSASRFAKRAREEWQRLNADIAAGKCDVLVLWEPSRGSRTLTEWSTTLDLCRKHGALIHVVTHSRTYDLSTARDWRTLADDGVDSSYESEKTRERILRTTASNAAQGRPHGRVPYGYKRVYNPDTKALIEQCAHPEEAPVVREVVQRLANGEPVIAIARDLNARNIPSPDGKEWGREAVRRLALRVTYIGKREYRGELLEGNWPPLVDPETFHSARSLLLAETRKTTKPGNAKYLLSYIARCGECGASMSAQKQRKGGREYTYYRCCGDRPCTAIRAPFVDDLVRDLICEKWLTDPGTYERLSAPDQSAAAAARAEVAALKARLQETYDAVADGTLSVTALSRIEGKMMPQIRDAEQRADELTVPGPLRALLGDNGRHEDVRARWDAADTATLREIVRAAADVRVFPAVGGARTTPDPSRVKITNRL
ncbi:MAG: recombinase family protein [Pseudonocardiaceae bacterium]